jgi:dipeptidyl aminopeptidase/acylaminoacyl peptidase
VSDRFTAGDESSRNTGWVRWAWGVLAVALVLGLPGPVAAAPEHAEIAFVSGDAIWAARADGSGRRLLIAPTRPRERLSQPVWSPEGSALAYVSDVAPPGERGTEKGAAQLMVFDGVAGRPLTPLRRGVHDQSPAWSPDGSRLAFQRAILTPNRFRTLIVTRTLSTGAERRLVGTGIGVRLRTVGEPVWSPDGTTIAYTHSRLDTESSFRPLIRTVPATGGDPRTLIRDAQSAAWSPDGARLAFSGVSDRNGRRCGSDECWYAGELYIAAADGTDLRRLTNNEGDDASPGWSPDGTRLLFTSDRNLPEGDSAEVYSVAPDGSCLTWLTNGTPSSGSATWRPGSGTRYDPGDCDPGSRPALIDTPTLPKTGGGLWLGPGFRGLLLSDTRRYGRRGYLAYEDCEHFEPSSCPQTVLLDSERVCAPGAFRGIHYFRPLRRRGAVLAYYDSEANARVYSGQTVTTIQLGSRSRLADVDRIVRALRPLGATRPVRELAPPRVPRRLARRLELTARALERHGTVEQAARALGVPRFHVSGRLRLRQTILSFGSYRFASCPR